MKKLFLIAVGIFLLQSEVSFSAPIKSQDLVRIRLKKSINEFTVSALGQVEYLDQNNKFKNLQSKSNFNKIKIQRIVSKNTNKNLNSEKNIWLISFNNQKIELNQKQLMIKASDLSFLTKPIPNIILLHPNANLVHQSDVVNFDVVGYEDINAYLAGVVSSEMPTEWPLEALKAQAVVAKSYLKAMQKERAHLHYDVEVDVQDQVFNKINWLQNNKYKNVMSAIRDTKDLVLVNQNKIYKSFYHSDCGGVTTTSEQVWGVKDASLSVKDHLCPLNPKSNWTYQLSKNQFNQLLSEYLKVQTHEIHEIKFVRDNQKQRVLKLQVKINNQDKIQFVAGDKLRELIGYNQMRSLLFEVSELDGELIFKGQGFGHGVGLCQWGTKRKAELGESFDQILKHYYPNVRLTSQRELSSQKMR